MTKEEQDAQAKAEADKKAAAAAGGNAGEGEPDELDIEVDAIMKDKAAVKKLLITKRDANAEAKKRRLEQEKLQKEKDDAEKKALTEQGKFKELAEKSEQKARDAEARQIRVTINAALKVAVLQAGIVDPSDAVALCDRAALKVGEDGETVEGVTEAVESLKKAKPYLFGEGGSKGAEKGNSSANVPGSPKPNLRGVLNNAATGPIDPVDRISAGLEKSKK